MVKLKLALPLAQLDAAREDMERFLHHHISEVGSRGELNDLLKNLSKRMAAHQSMMRQIVLSKPLQHAEVAQLVMAGMSGDQLVESNFFPGILEGLLGRLGIAPGEKNPPTSSREGAARLWASAVLETVQKTENRQVRLETSVKKLLL